MKRLLLSSTFILGACASAFAADAVMIDPPVDVIVAPGFNWTGGYIGGQVGYAWGDAHAQTLTSGSFADPDPDGFIGGVYVGYNYQMPSNVVLGIEADATFGSVDGYGQAYFANGTPQAGASFEQELNWSGAVRGRLGYAMDRFLPYIAGGVAFGDVDINTTIGGVPIDSFSDTYVGWTIGGGVEYAFTDNMIARVEYRYTDLGDAEFTPTAPAETFSADFKTHDVRFGLAWKF